MRKFLSAIAMMMVFAVTAWAQGINHYQCAAVDNADAIIGIDVANFSQSQALAPLKQLMNNILKGQQNAKDDDMKEFKKFCAIMGIDTANLDKLVLHAMVTVAFNGANPDNPDLTKLDAVAAALLAGPINFDKFPEAFKATVPAFDQKTVAISKKTYKNAVAFELKDTSDTPTPGFDRLTIALVRQNALFLGTTKSVEKALNRVDNQQAPKNMDPFLFGQDGQIQIAMRMFPEMKASLTAMGAQIPGAAVLANSKGFALLLNATDKFTVALNLQTAKAADAAAFKAQVWDVQVAPMVGAISQMAKAQSNNQLNVLDSIKCSVNGPVLGVSASFTFNDIILAVATFQKMQAAQAQAQAAPAAPAVKDAPAQANDDDDEEAEADEEDDEEEDEEEEEEEEE